MIPAADTAIPGQGRRRTAHRTLLLAVWGILLTTVLAGGAMRTTGRAVDPHAGGVAKGGQPTATKGPAKSAAAPDARIARGKYLVTIGSCNDCHTPLTMGKKGPEPDMSRMLSGHPETMPLPAPPQLATGAPWNWSGDATSTAFAGPWGISFAINLTPDRNTGLGVWSEPMFVKALRTGKHMGQSRDILPPMPWQGIGQMTDDDLGAVYAYLRSIPAIANRVPDAVVAPMPPAAAPGKR